MIFPLALMHPALQLDFLLILQVCAWCVWGVSALASTLPAASKTHWRWFGIGALTKGFAISQTTLFAQITDYDRVAVRDVVYLTLSTVALLCWIEHAARLPGLGRKGSWAWRIVGGALAVAWGAACATGHAWNAWPWLGGMMVPVIALVGAARSHSTYLRLTYLCFGALALVEWADPDRFFCWYASFTPNLALTWDALDAVFSNSGSAAVNNGQLFMHVPDWVLAVCAGATACCWSGVLLWQKWLGNQMPSGDRRLKTRIAIPLAAAALVFSGFLVYSVNMAAAAKIVSEEGYNRLRTIARSLDDDPDAARLPALAEQNRGLGIMRIIEVRDNRLHVIAGHAPDDIHQRPIPVSLQPAFAGDTLFWFGPVLEESFMYFYGVVPLGGAHGNRWLLNAQPYDYGGFYRRPMARSAALVITLLILLGGAVLAYSAVRERELRQKAAREQAEAAERSQTELLATLGHDVRTPLQSMLAYGELLASTSLDERQQSLLGALREQTHSLHHLLQNLLHLGAAQLALPPRADRIELASLLADLAQATQGAAEARGLIFSTHLSPTAPTWVIGDDTRLRQILLNLLGNAVKYTVQGEIRFEITSLHPSVAGPGEAWLAFRISDTGPGLTEEQRRRLFSLQIAPETERGPGAGFGLGLPLVGKLSLLLGGAVIIEETSPRGTVIVVRLPFRRPPKATIPESSPSESSPPFVPKRVLLVDDHPVLRSAMAESLAAHGFQLQTAATIAEAQRAWRDNRFDCALIDLGLPDGSGLSLAKVFRDTAVAPVWLVAVTAAAGIEAEASVLAAGFDAYVPKPVAPSVLAAKLRGETVTLSAEIPTALSPASMADLQSDWTRRLADMDEAIAARNADAVVYLAHYLKSNALIARNSENAAILIELEQAARSENWPAIAVVRRRLRDKTGTA